jgi:hypothetical protein
LGFRTRSAMSPLNPKEEQTNEEKEAMVVKKESRKHMVISTFGTTCLEMMKFDGWNLYSMVRKPFNFPPTLLAKSLLTMVDSKILRQKDKGAPRELGGS